METKRIPIQCHKNYLKRDLEETKEEDYTLDLNKNIFDPSKSSPPNEFMEKLNKRIDVYNQFNSLSSSPGITCNMTLLT